ncbi:translation termination inhibitor protein itt1 [Lignoscripta atroalba]|nr:translation termination inhibitor protein itt1 [Lignoscripta atroalba]
MDDDLESLEDERAVELSAIAAIFPELVIDPSNPFSACLDLPISPSKPLAVLFPPLAGGAPPVGLLTPPSSDGTSDGVSAKTVMPDHQSVQDIHYLSHLPPLTLRIELPDGYPAQTPPTFNVQADISWLPHQKLQELRDGGRKLWEDLGRDQVVFSYIDYLQQEAEVGFGLVSDGADFLEVRQDLKIGLLDHDTKAKRAKFEQETFECGVCLEPKKGSGCHRLFLCSHVFCVACLQDFYNSCITEGDITNVKCLTPNCGNNSEPQSISGQRRKKRQKDDRTLDPSELLQIPLEQDIVQRYVKLKRKKMLESDRTTVYCPRQWCQGAARSKKYPKTDDHTVAQDSDSEEDEPPVYDPNVGEDKLPPPSERLAICEDCAFAFCKVCKSGWHGEFAKCFPRRKYELTAEEKASEDYMKLHTTPCPTCDARCQKTMGCNHMICFKCNTHFCYLCSSWLMEGNPYQHFNTPNSPCYLRLWELEGGDGADVGLGFAGGAANAGAIDIHFQDDDSDDEDVPHPPPVAPAPPRPRAPNPPQQVAANARRPNQAARGNHNANAVRVNARVQQGLARAQALPGHGPPVQGLQRFLQLVEVDEEEDWDSDELDEDDDEDDDDRWVIPVR